MNDIAYKRRYIKMLNGDKKNVLRIIFPHHNKSEISTARSTPKFITKKN